MERRSTGAPVRAAIYSALIYRLRIEPLSRSKYVLMIERNDYLTRQLLQNLYLADQDKIIYWGSIRDNNHCPKIAEAVSRSLSRSSNI
jgi:hypothetical protein